MTPIASNFSCLFCGKNTFYLNRLQPRFFWLKPLGFLVAIFVLIGYYNGFLYVTSQNKLNRYVNLF